jgi:RNA polymerase sigma-70 factor (ECF subfamily)
MNLPETNPSLIVRLRDSGDERAWFEFVEIYRPAIVRLGGLKGLQPADCEDLAQKVFVSVAGAIERWEPNSQRAKFRTWLFTIANRHVIDALRRQAVREVSGGSHLEVRLENTSDRQEDSRILRTELRRQVFHRVASVVRDEFTENTWQSFWLMAVEGLSAEVVAPRVGKTAGAVYAAKARVMRRIVEHVREFGDELSQISEFK